jgi:hypothetical protein
MSDAHRIGTIASSPQLNNDELLIYDSLVPVTPVPVTPVPVTPVPVTPGEDPGSM